ncbi:enoyl-CoA hydratase/isomerase family protein [Rhizobium sp. RU36D]|uniref:enoyl-CoA hydratase/isomerase family protein n=1 Tax=Rhizobium sp. RU36D TaxID=1907415 RepID=UPI0009D8419B|nr:enoyl-CoA hydratase/isomerase family protein [Rhizobium sp. RU36D]SMC86550.1 Enoyl-CoA hydratase/carnithine racemase [Rhizobium sp. RU36D]
MSELLIAEKENVLEVTFNRPDKGNALTPEMVEAIRTALDALSPDIRAVVIRANGEDFCTGRAPSMPAPGSRVTALDLRKAVSDPVLDFYQRLRDVPVPLIAVVQGRAAGVGCAIAALADLAIAAETASFQIPEMNHDIAPTLVLNALADRLPRAALARMVLSRDVIPAAEAKTIGLIGMTAAPDHLASECDRLVGQLRSNSPAPLRAVKSFLAIGLQSSPASRNELAALLNCVATAERYR